MDTTNNSPAIVVSIPGLLMLLFIYLKLTGKIGWSWWWVLSPLWAPVVLYLIILVGVNIIGRS